MSNVLLVRLDPEAPRGAVFDSIVGISGVTVVLDITAISRDTLELLLRDTDRTTVMEGTCLLVCGSGTCSMPERCHPTPRPTGRSLRERMNA